MSARAYFSMRSVSRRCAQSAFCGTFVSFSPPEIVRPARPTELPFPQKPAASMVSKIALGSELVMLAQQAQIIVRAVHDQLMPG